MGNKAQASIEFSLAFVVTILFIVLSVNLFVWFGHCLVQRQRGFEDTRSSAGNCIGEECEGSGVVGRSDFFTPPKFEVFKPGGYEK